MTADADAAALVRKAQRGDTLAMNDLLDLLGPFVSRVCGPIALSDGADAAQETLIKVFTSLRDLREPAAVYGWTRRIAVRQAVRVAARRADAVPDELSRLPQPGDPQLASDIDDVLSRLSPRHRAILLLRDRDGFDEATAARLLDVAPGTVKSRLHRARHYFRKAWTS